jgi:hypothetical protein
MKELVDPLLLAYKDVSTIPCLIHTRMYILSSF